MTAPEWRDCADPDELAAAVAAGVEVEVVFSPDDVWTTERWNETADQFAEAIRRGARYRVPTSWKWRPEPPAPDELRERLRLGIEDAVNDYADVVMDIMDAEVVRHAGWLAARLEEADAERTTLRHRLVETAPTPPPVPPWPGAVLSGCVDEDGAPTWLAQAPNVLGEAVRTCVDFPWFICGSDNAVTPYWVEVRGGQVAVAVEPETERVPWYSVVADQRRLVGFPKVGGTRYGADGCLAFTDHDGVLLANVHDPAIGWDGSGTVEVLKDGDQ